MAIEFIVEDGTGKENATSYVTVAEYVQYWENRGTDYSTVVATTVQGYLNSATEWIDMSYKFIGAKADDNQALEWPRYDVDDIDSDEIPTDLKSAVCYMAAQVKTGINQIDSGVTSESYGKISKTYSTNGIKTYPVADKLLRGYVASGNPVLRVN